MGLTVMITAVSLSTIVY